MKKIVYGFLLATLFGCSSLPVSVTKTTSMSAPDAFTCALGKLNQLGYTIGDANKEAGFVKAEKRIANLNTKLGGFHKYQSLNVSVFSDPSSGQTSLKVTAGSIKQDITGLVSSDRVEYAPSPQTTADANEIVASCGMAK